MIFSGLIANGRPMLLYSLRLSCLEKKEIFASIWEKISIEVFIVQVPCGACSIVYEKSVENGSFVIQSIKQ